jgi:hypothetical protein
LQKACKAFNNAIASYNISSLRSNVLNIVVTTALKKLNEKTYPATTDAETLFQYLITLNSPSKLAYVDIPKKIILYYFDHEYFNECLENLDCLMQHYAPKKDLLAFAIWKKARTYSEMANHQKEETARLSLNNKAITCYKTILMRYPEIEIYCSYAHEELAKIYRSLGEFSLANSHEKEIKKDLTD